MFIASQNNPCQKRIILLKSLAVYENCEKIKIIKKPKCFRPLFLQDCYSTSWILIDVIDATSSEINFNYFKEIYISFFQNIFSTNIHYTITPPTALGSSATPPNLASAMGVGLGGSGRYEQRQTMEENHVTAASPSIGKVMNSSMEEVCHDHNFQKKLVKSYFCLFRASLFEFWRLLIGSSVGSQPIGSLQLKKVLPKRQKYDLKNFLKIPNL